MKLRASLFFRLAGVIVACMAVVAISSLMPAPSASASTHSNARNTASRWAVRFTSPPPGGPARSRGNCAEVRAHLAQDAARGIRRVMCVTPTTAGKPSSVPSLCQPNQPHVVRFSNCVDESWSVTIVDTQTGQVLGTNTGWTIFWNTLSYKSRFWNENIEVQVTGATGEGASTTFTAPIECQDLNPLAGPDCLSTGSGSWAGQTGYLTAGAPTVYTGELGWESPGSATVEFEFKVVMNFKNPNTEPSGPVTFGPGEAVRCDSKAYFKPTSGGCVYPAETQNVLSLSKSDSTITQAAKFIENAQSAIPNHVGEYGPAGPLGPALTRTTDPSKIRRNRSVACRGVHPGKGQSCDEYPFASTDQGAALVPPGYFKAAPVNAKQNSKVGSLLGSFFLKQRIIDRDPFYVEITP